MPQNAFWVHCHQQEALLHIYGFTQNPMGSTLAMLWKLIPEPLTDGRIIIALDDYINPKTEGKSLDAPRCLIMPPNRINQNIRGRKNIVAVGLLKIVKGRWACLPLSHRFYHLKKTIETIKPTIRRRKIKFQTKLKQAAT